MSIAVLDTETFSTHPDLRKLLGTMGKDGVSPGGEGHGTMVAGVACAEAGNNVGIAGCSYNAKLIPVIAADREGKRTLL